MEPDSALVRELFDLPGAKSAEIVSPYRAKEGANAAASMDLGRKCLHDGDAIGAIKHYRRAIEQSEGGGHEILLELGAAYEAAGQTPQAYRQYLKALKSSDSSELHRGVSEVLQSFGKYRQAAEELRAAIAKEPKNAYNHFRLAEVLRKAGYKKLALAAVTQAVSLAADDAFYHYWMGDLQLELGAFEECVASLSAAIELSPGDDKLFQLAGVGMWGAGKKSEAIRSVRLASDLNSEDLVNYGLLEAFLKFSGQVQEAQQESKNAKRMDDYDKDLLARYLKLVGIEWA